MPMEKIWGKARTGGEGEGTHWLTVSDLMAGLMMVFLFIAVVLMRNAFLERDKIKEIAVAHQENQVAIYEALVDEFSADLDRWDAQIFRDALAFEFKSPDVLLGSTPIPWTVWLRLQTLDPAGRLYDAFAGCGTSPGNRTRRLAPHPESGTGGGSRAPA